MCRFTDCKLHSIDSSQDADVVLRTVASQKLNKILLREYRPHLMASSATYEPHATELVMHCNFIVIVVSSMITAATLAADNAASEQLYHPIWPPIVCVKVKCHFTAEIVRV